MEKHKPKTFPHLTQANCTWMLGWVAELVELQATEVTRRNADEKTS